MIPAFLAPFQSEIEKRKLDTIKIKATPLANGEKLAITQSKFLGQPYLPVGMDYPKGTDGKPLIMLAQINFAEAPALENYPAEGILQLFVHPTKWDEMKDYKVLFHEAVTDNFQTNFGFLKPNLFDESPIECEHKLEFRKETEYGSVCDFRFDVTFGGKSYDDYQETLPQAEMEELENLFYITGHKIGGYASFTQEDPRSNDDKSKDDVLLLQVDSDRKIMFGDSGVANVFINIEDLKNKRFDKAYFNWDCC
ncbi:YwqG family protein [Taibaiella soli]|uniref:DUF1963 domain-containing protein n=1 Tax=Taibaiella soli TaxID=1649169 RepID=A0A2W2BMT8_9BACT|nr:DUF1963 domain-containing protein [Taibaiella soli]PZF74766.1 DUF1963 domain-containing protein [Taibaiella soli]